MFFTGTSDFEKIERTSATIFSERSHIADSAKYIQTSKLGGGGGGGGTSMVPE